MLPVEGVQVLGILNKELNKMHKQNKERFKQQKQRFIENESTLHRAGVGQSKWLKSLHNYVLKENNEAFAKRKETVKVYMESLA